MSKTTTTGFKRHYPRKKRCCCCFSLKTGIIAFTIFFLICRSIIITRVAIIYGILSYNLIELIANAIFIITLLLLLFGICKVKLSFMRQFKYAFAVYLIFITFNWFISIYKFINDNTYYDNNNEILLFDFDMNTTAVNTKMTKEEMKDKIIEYKEKTLLYSTFTFILLKIYYYIATCSYIEDVEEELYENNSLRSLEDNKI